MSSRLHGDRGTAFVAAMVLMFTVTGAAAFYLARGVNERVSDRSALQSIAFQAARAGAQQLDIDVVRDSGEARIDVGAAEIASQDVVVRLGRQYGLAARIDAEFATDDGGTWNVVVVASGATRGELRVLGVARAQIGG